MPRKARKDLESQFFHIMVQGIRREDIFKNDKHKKKYKQLLIKYSTEKNIKILAYCIMNNHAHILIKTSNIKSMSEFMRYVNTNYGNYYNRIEERVGFVFRDRYLSEPIYNEKYLINCISYIHMNPVKAGLIDRQENYRYSTYKEYMGKGEIITNEIIKIIFPDEKNYKDKLLQIDNFEKGFIECDKRNNIKELLDEYCINNNMNLIEILYSKKESINLITYLVYEHKKKIVEISKALGIHRLKISRLIKEKKNVPKCSK